MKEYTIAIQKFEYQVLPKQLTTGLYFVKLHNVVLWICCFLGESVVVCFSSFFFLFLMHIADFLLIKTVSYVPTSEQHILTTV